MYANTAYNHMYYEVSSSNVHTILCLPSEKSGNYVLCPNLPNLFFAKYATYTVIGCVCVCVRACVRVWVRV